MVEKRDIFNDWLDIYHSGKKKIFRKELCILLNISSTNQTTYNQVINPLIEDGAVFIGAVNSNKILLNINKDELDRFIKSKINYKKVENFILKSNPFAIT